MKLGPHVINSHTLPWGDILELMHRGVTVITGNKRLAGVVRALFDQAALDKRLATWPSPDILPWSAWLQREWEEAVINGALPTPELLLTAHQEQLIWEEIIGDSLADQPLQQLAGTVRRAQEAWQLIQAWQLPLIESLFSYNDDSTVFYDWAIRFEARCARASWLASARVADELQSGIAAGRLTPPAGLALIGFDELTPQQQSLLQALMAAGCDVRWIQPAGRKSRAAGVACVDVRQEALNMARWVRQRLDDNAGQQIGVIVPELSSLREIIAQSLDEVLVPQVQVPANESTPRPYNISLGQPLSSYPIISTALKLLGLLQPSITMADAGVLLRSPFLAGWAEEASARALLDGRLRETGELYLSLKTLRYYGSQTDMPHSCPQLVEKIDGWIETAQDGPRRCRPGRWAARFSALLKAIGWAAGRSLSSEEYQASEAWRDLLADFSALDPVAGEITAGAALTLLRRLAGQRSFQPQTGEAPVQVLGVLEAGGLQFDAVWVMGLHDGVWPASPRPNPFIPLQLQRKAGLPHSSEARELQVAHGLCQRILNSADEVMVSFPLRNGDEALRPSPLIAELPRRQPEDLSLWPGRSWRDEVHHSARLDVLEDDPAPPLAAENTRGGSAVFKLQAACPFRAFAELRLGARALGYAEIGLDAMTRGSLVHRVLEKVWQALATQERLLSLEDSALESLIGDCVAEAIDEIARRYPQTFTGRFRQMEAGRLCRQAHEWLELEKQRPPFRVVGKEQTHAAMAGGLRVQVKVDRIDETADGRLLVIDYKTGEVKPAQWFGERPDEPQLPLYSLAIEGDIAGVCFAQVRAGGMGFNGVAEAQGLVPGVKSYDRLRQTRDADSWASVLQDWRLTMEHLAEDFRAGQAAVDPKRFPATCSYCELQPLCRIDEHSLMHVEEYGAPDPGDPA